jgi:DUF4097 and DUF4098 domain-containing protein YvlB
MCRKKKLTNLVLSLLMLLVATAYGWAGDERTEEFEVKPGGVLVLDCSDGGSAAIEGWDQSVVRVTCWADCNDLDDYKIEFRPDDDGLEIDAELRRRRNNTCLHFEIKVPRRFDVEFHSAGGGLSLQNLEGAFTGRTGGGQFELNGVKGRARLRSGGGQIEVIDCELDGKIQTGGGEVLLEDVVGDLDAHSGGGEIRYVNVRDRDGALRGPGHCPERGITAETVLIASAGGSIRVRKAPAGACVQTGGGDVSVRNAAQFVHASTGGGDIDVEIGSGAVTASTGAGDLDVVIERDGDPRDAEVELRTGYGDVELVVPKGYSMDLDLTIGYTRSSRRNYEIRCHVPFAEERTTEWDYGYGDRGSAQKYIYGTGSVGGGRHRIRIRTTNGNITIRER